MSERALVTADPILKSSFTTRNELNCSQILLGDIHTLMFVGLQRTSYSLMNEIKKPRMPGRCRAIGERERKKRENLRNNG